MVEARRTSLKDLAHQGLLQQDPTIDRFVKITVDSRATQEQDSTSLGRRAERIARAEIFRDRNHSFLGTSSSRDIVVEGGAILNVSRYNAVQDGFDNGLGPRTAIIIEKEGDNAELKKAMGKNTFLAIVGAIKGVSINIDREDDLFDNVGILSIHENKTIGRRESAGIIRDKYLKGVDRNNARNMASLLMDLIENSEQYQQLQA